LLHEELTRSATRDEAQEVTQRDLNLYLCANRTCEVGMEHATRAPYESFVYGLEELTRAKDPALIGSNPGAAGPQIDVF
jgi:D-lactate dehydrogenase